MLTGLFNGLIDNLVCYYLSSVCIISISCWMIWAYTHSEKWQKVIRDCTMYLVTIMVTGTVMILFRNLPVQQTGHPIFIGIAWFAFSMLLIMELLWLSYAVDNIVQHCRQSFSTFYSSPTDKSRDFRVR
jgi:hypothetical protein